MAEPQPAGAWKRTPEWLKDAFADALPEDPRVEPRRMFGYPCAFVGGNMFCGTFQDRVLVRLGEDERAAALAKKGVKPFEPMPGRPMKEYVEVPGADAKDAKKLKAWIARGFEYGASLPVKKQKPKKKPKS